MATVILRPNSQSTCQLTPVGHANNYENVNEVTLDTSDYNYCTNTAGSSDIFGFNSTGLTTETINQITFTFKGTSTSGIAGITQYNYMYLGGSWYSGTGNIISTLFDTSTETFTVNPATGSAWTVAQLDSLYAAYMLVVGAFPAGYQGRAHQYYITVTYSVTPPDAPTNVTASTNSSTEVIISWTKSAGATGYRVYNGAGYNISGLLGDVDHYHYESSLPVITSGTAAASNGTSPTIVSLSLTGASIANGASDTYTVKAVKEDVLSVASSGATGYRAAGTLTYQWQVSADDSNDAYSDISGATTTTYNHELLFNTGRYFKCKQNATGSNQQTSNTVRGYTFRPTKPCFAAIY